MKRATDSSIRTRKVEKHEESFYFSNIHIYQFPPVDENCFLESEKRLMGAPNMERWKKKIKKNIRNIT